MRALAFMFVLFFASSAYADDVRADAFVADRESRRAGAKEIDRLTSNLLFGRRNAERDLLRFLERETGPEHRQAANEALCGHRFRQQRYAEAISVCEAAGAADTLSIARAAENERPVSWTGAVRLPLEHGRISVSANGESTPAVFDTGAEVTVIMASAAQRLGARPLQGDVSVSTTTDEVQGGLVMIDLLQIGEGEARNVLALMLPDEQLTFGDFSLPMILGLPVIVASGRVGLLEHGRVVTLGDATPRLRGSTTPLYWDEGGVGLALDFAGGRRGGHLDTGSDRTYLFPAATSALSEAERATRTPVERRYAGVGGERIETWSRFDIVTLRVAGRTWLLEGVEMAANDENGEAARVGLTMLTRFESVVLDFPRMRATVSH